MLEASVEFSLLSLKIDYTATDKWTSPADGRLNVRHFYDPFNYRRMGHFCSQKISLHSWTHATKISLMKSLLHYMHAHTPD